MGAVQKGHFKIRIQKLSLIINWLQIEKMRIMVFMLDPVLLIAYGFSLPIAVPPIPSNFDFKKISCPSCISCISCLSWTNLLQGQKWARSKKVISKIRFQKLSLIINWLQIKKCE